MSKFIKLKAIIVNVNYIQSIIIQPNKYYINLMTNKTEGYYWKLAALGMGNSQSYNYTIEVCETKNSGDYKIVSNWIDTHATDNFDKV